MAHATGYLSQMRDVKITHMSMHNPYAEVYGNEANAMRTTLNIDDQLFEEAVRLTGIKEKTALLRESLKALIQRESARYGQG